MSCLLSHHLYINVQLQKLSSAIRFVAGVVQNRIAYFAFSDFADVTRDVFVKDVLTRRTTSCSQATSHMPSGSHGVDVIMKLETRIKTD